MNYPDMYVEDDESNTLCQGDIFLNFDEEVLPDNDNWQYAPYIVLTYSCDLARPKEILYLAVSPVMKFEELLTKTLEKYKTKTRDPKKNKEQKSKVLGEILNLANSRQKFFFFLSPIVELKNVLLYSDLSRVFSISNDYIEIIIQKRIKSLDSPWREKLGYKIGNLYNRVAINDEDEVKKDTIKNYIFTENKELVEKFIFGE
ncbi:MAG: hypothetical protein ACXADY_02860 [Candidatus Hodarchaeales archaeon]|jgi:hypothetical protein